MFALPNNRLAAAHGFAVSATDAAFAQVFGIETLRLGGSSSNRVTLGAGAADSANIGHYVNFATSGNDLVLRVDTTGNSSFGGGTQDVAALTGYALGNQHSVNVVFNNHDHHVAVV